MTKLPDEIEPQLTIQGRADGLRFIIRSCDDATLELIYRDDEHSVESAIAIPNSDARNVARALEMFADWFDAP